MNNKDTSANIRKVREILVNDMAQQICSVQPMVINQLQHLYEVGETTEELKKRGYRPVSRIGLMWVKDER